MKSREAEQNGVVEQEDKKMAMEIGSNYCNAEQVNAEKEVLAKTKGTETEKKSSYKTKREYQEYLNQKYAALVPTKDSSVTINPRLLSKAASDSRTAAWLEKTLSEMPDCIDKISENLARSGARLLSLQISVDSENCTKTLCGAVCEADPGTEEAEELLEKARARNKERKKEQEKMLERNKEKKAEQEKQAEKEQEQALAENRRYTITVMGTDVKKMTDHLINKISMGGNAVSKASTLVGLDIKA